MEITVAEIESALDELGNLPTPVSGWLVETGLDSADEPAVWVWALLADDEVDFDTRSGLRDMIRKKVRGKTGPSVWAYVRFRGASETVPAG